MILLAFDLASNTGVAVGDSSSRPICSSEQLGDTGASHGARFAQALVMTKRLILEHKPDFIIVEQAIASGAPGAASRVQLAMGLRACVYATCHFHHIKFREYPVQTIRKHFIGRGNLKRDAAKGETINRCKRLGWAIANDNEADAAAAWDLARARLVGHSSISGDLFNGKDVQS
jgi:Holliday junction resolvasome RuvABC endonuclease subunit